MCEVLYQRAEPRQKIWLPLISQQIRLRNIQQIFLVNPTLPPDCDGLYVTLHISPMSAPFFTSGRVSHSNGGSGAVIEWSDLQVTQCSVNLSLEACIIRIWTSEGHSILSWGVHFKGLHYLGHSRDDWAPSRLKENTIIFVTPFGFLTSLQSVINPTNAPQRFLTLKSTPESPPIRLSYSLKKLSSLHHIQRGVLDEHDLGIKRRGEIELSGFNVSRGGTKVMRQLVMLSERLVARCKLGEQKLRLREEIEQLRLRLGSLEEEKGRTKERISRLKKESGHFEEMTAAVVSNLHGFTEEKISLAHTKSSLVTKGQTLGNLRSGVFLRKKQLISELLQIYPLALVEGSKKYSINGVQLPNAEDYISETGGQISVALGYSSHLTAMLAFFLDIPCRYPIRHFGSRSRIIDHITIQIPDKEREFPLYFKGKKDVYCAYAVYLLNKNIAQLRWYCGLSTPDLRATLPNLVQLLSSRLVIAGWPPNLGETLEIAQEITEEIVSQLFENELTLSLDKGLDKLSSAVTETAAYLDEGFSDENPGGNSVAVGEVKHGRGQERFLSGWKKKTYVETDDFDPKWLMDSMNLDFDSGRRLSISQPSSTSPPKNQSHTTDSFGGVTISVSSDDDNNVRRRRRVGQVDAPTPTTLLNLVEGEVTEQQSASLNRTNTPSKDMIKLESEIKEFERRKSRGAMTAQQRQSLVIPAHHALGPSAKSGSGGGGNEWSDCQNCDTTAATNREIRPVNIIPANRNPSPCQEMVHVQQLDTSLGYHVQLPVVVKSEEVSGPTGAGDNTIEETKSLVPDEVVEIPQSNTFQRREKQSPQKATEPKNDESGTADLSLRTEALLGGSSFNLVRRRLSTSEST